jgi:hypothetical protein
MGIALRKENVEARLPRKRAGFIGDAVLGHRGTNSCRPFEERHVPFHLPSPSGPTLRRVSRDSKLVAVDCAALLAKRGNRVKA